MDYNQPKGWWRKLMNLPKIKNECEHLVKCFISFHEALERYSDTFKKTNPNLYSTLGQKFKDYQLGDYEEVTMDSIEKGLNVLQPDEAVLCFTPLKFDVEVYKDIFKDEYNALTKQRPYSADNLISQVDNAHKKYWEYVTTLNDIILKCLYEEEVEEIHV